VRLSRVAANIEAVAARLDGVNVENLDWRAVLKRYDAPDTFFFADPPYIRASDTNYSAWSPEEMGQLRAALDQIAGQWLVTVDDSPECRRIFAGLPMIEVARANGTEMRAGRRKNPIYRELIIRSPMPRKN